MLSRVHLRVGSILTLLLTAALVSAAVTTRPFACGYNADGETGVGVASATR